MTSFMSLRKITTKGLRKVLWRLIYLVERGDWSPTVFKRKTLTVNFCLFGSIRYYDTKERIS